MVDAQTFIDAKAFQLSNYADAFISGIIPTSEVTMYCWDTLEEWSQYDESAASISQLESAFWYLLHQISFWQPNEIKSCPELKSEIDLCIDYLRGDGIFPNFVAGVRP